MKRLLIVLLIVSLFTPIALAAARTWKSSNGKYSVEAELIGFEDGKVKLKKANGKVVKVPLESLSDADQKFVKEQYSKDDEPDDAKKKEKENKTPPPKEEPKQEEATDVAENDAQEVEMKLLSLEPPERRSSDKTATLKSYLLQLTRPQSIVQRDKDSGAAGAKFKRIVKKEPKYVVPIPVRGVVKFGGKEYAFALDAVAKKAGGYDRLYFDANGDGDLTDDPTTSALSAKKQKTSSKSQFPPVKVTLNVGGESVEYAFLLNVYCTLVQDKFRANVSIYSAVAREGYFNFENKRTKVVLVDHNSNGCFNDAVSVQANGRLTEGDMLLIDPDPGKGASAPGSGSDVNMVGKVLCVGKTFYRVTIAPGGGKLQLEPMQIELGSVICSNFAYRAILTNDDYGVVILTGGKGQEIVLAEGSWKVVGYTLFAGGNRTYLEASYGRNWPTVAVKKGETVALPFGGAYRTVVTGGRGKNNKISLLLAIVGPSGERCRQILVNGRRPPKPQFVIKNGSDEAVHQGKFEYG